MINRSLLDSILRQLKLDAQTGLADGLESYVSAIEQWNPAWGLVGANGDELLIKHIGDSLAPLHILDELIAERQDQSGTAEQSLSLADLGTGAGLPGIPLALAKPAMSVYLVDRMTRRINFLRMMQTQLNLSNVTIVEQQVEHAKGYYDFITFRAFRPFEYKLFKKIFGLLKPGGYLLAYKGKADKAEAELEAIASLYGRATILPLEVPFLADERCLVLLQARLA